jgi:hypothetical protein
MKIFKRYEFTGPQGKRWTEWFEFDTALTVDEANMKIEEAKSLNAGRNEEYVIR